MLTARLSCFLPAFLLCSATATGAEVTTVTSGENVTLVCPSVFEVNDTVDVEWQKDGGFLCKYHIKENKISHYYDCKPQFRETSKAFKLILTGVTSSDAGLYNCTVTRITPPPLEDRFSTLRLPVNGLTLQQLNSSNTTCVELLCSLEALCPEQVNFTWSKADLALPDFHNTAVSSTLRLCMPDGQDGDTLTCHASYANNSIVYSKNITLTWRNTAGSVSSVLVVTSAVGACLGLLLILFSVAVHKYRKRRTANEPVVFNNKVYENFSFFTARSNAEPGFVSYPGHNTRPTAQTGPGNQGEESIYEN